MIKHGQGLLQSEFIFKIAITTSHMSLGLNGDIYRY